MTTPVAYYTYDEARKHKRLWSGVWSSVIWVDAADGIDLAVIHWMGGGYKVVGRYRSQEREGIEHAKAHAERCSADGYCPTTPEDSASYRAHIGHQHPPTKRLDLTTETGRLKFAQQAYMLFCEGMADNPSRARTRLIAGIQVAIRDAIETGSTPVLTERELGVEQMTYRPILPDEDAWRIFNEANLRPE